jgi:hypothetical protein
MPVSAASRLIASLKLYAGGRAENKKISDKRLTTQANSLKCAPHSRGEFKHTVL